MFFCKDWKLEAVTFYCGLLLSIVFLNFERLLDQLLRYWWRWCFSLPRCWHPFCDNSQGNRSFGLCFERLFYPCVNSHSVHKSEQDVKGEMIAILQNNTITCHLILLMSFDTIISYWLPTYSSQTALMATVYSFSLCR